MPVQEMVTELLEKAPGQKQILAMVTRLVGNEGVGGIVSKFTNAGHAEKVQSWVGTGPNKPLSSDEVEKVLGPEKIDEAAREAGIPRAQAADRLAEALPKVVNELTPEGKVPDREVFDDLVGKLKGFLK